MRTSAEQQSMLDEIEGMLRTVLEHKDLNGAPLPLDTSLYEAGIGLDSLDTAAFSSMLEAAYGTDPYSAGVFPETLEDVLRFYQGESLE